MFLVFYPCVFFACYPFFSMLLACFDTCYADLLCKVSGNTYSGNPVSCATALAVLDEYERQDVIANTVRMGAHMREGLEALKRKHPTLGDVTSPEELQRYQQWKRDYKKASKGS